MKIMYEIILNLKKRYFRECIFWSVSPDGVRSVYLPKEKKKKNSQKQTGKETEKTYHDGLYISPLYSLVLDIFANLWMSWI